MSHDAHAEHGHDAADDAHHDAHHDEPPPPPEPETPLWFTLVGAVLFVVLGVAFLTMTSDDAPPKPAPAAKRAQAAAAAAAAPPASGPVPPPRRQPPRPTAVELRRRSPGLGTAWAREPTARFISSRARQQERYRPRARRAPAQVAAGPRTRLAGVGPRGRLRPRPRSTLASMEHNASGRDATTAPGLRPRAPRSGRSGRRPGPAPKANSFNELAPIRLVGSRPPEASLECSRSGLSGGGTPLA